MSGTEVSSGKRKRVRDYLACDTHGDETAEQVCGECGTPVCDDCADRVNDMTLNDYEPGAARHIAVALGLVFVVPFLVNLVPQGVSLALADLAGKDSPLYYKGGLALASMLVGVAMLASVRYRPASSASDFELLTRNSNERVVCGDCKSEKSVQQGVYYLVAALGVLVALYGVWTAVDALFFRSLRVAGVGGAIFVLRAEITTFVLGFLE